MTSFNGNALPPAIANTPPPERFDAETGAERLRVAFPSVLSSGMTAELEKRLVDHAIERLNATEQEMGRDQVLSDDWHVAGIGGDSGAGSASIASNTWMGRRCRWEAVFNNDLSWRPNVLPTPNIFQDSNLVVPMSRRICRQLTAKAQNYFFATDPWFGANAEGVEDGDLADKIERYLKLKLEQVGTKRQLERAVAKAFILGETVVKTTYTVREEMYQTTVSALVGADGTPELDRNGQMILESASWLPTETPGVEVLESDGVTVKPEATVFMPQKITKRHVLFSGAEADPIYFKDFVCELSAKDVQTARFCAHLYDKPLAAMIDLYTKRGVFSGTDETRYEAAKSAAAAVSEMMNNTASAKTGASQTVLTGEQWNGRGSANAPFGPDATVVEIAECWMKFDPFGDGMECDVFMVLDRKNQLPLYYDYTANTTPNGTRPLDVVRINEIDGRWYGLGVMEMFDTTQTIVDLLVNRWNFSQSRSGRIDFTRPDLTLEGENDPNFRINYGESYTLKKDAEAKDVFSSVYLNDTKFDALQNMFQFFMQLSLNESGVTNANDAGMLGMDSQKLATGIKNVEKAGDELFAPFLSDLQPGLLSILNRCMNVTLANLDEEETFQYFDGETVMKRTITPEEVANVKLNVTLELSRYKSQQTVEQSKAIIEAVNAFYAQPPEIQARTAQFYRNMVKGFDPRVDVNEVISPMMPVMPPGAVVPGAPSAGQGGAIVAPAGTQPMPAAPAPLAGTA